MLVIRHMNNSTSFAFSADNMSLIFLTSWCSAASNTEGANDRQADSYAWASLMQDVHLNTYFNSFLIN